MRTTELTLKRIIENLDVMPNTLGQYMGDDEPKLTKEQKRKLLEMVAAYNDYGKVFENMEQMMETAKALEEIATMAETFAVNESGEWFAADKVKKDFVDVKKRVGEFKKFSKETYTRMQEMAALYEDIGHILKRYYDIRDLTPGLPKSSANDPQGDVQPMRDEVIKDDVDPNGEFGG